ncbi:MAG: antitoxin AF2212-like protein [Desulfococcaceae bacterium]
MITAIYERGALHPAVPLDLQEHQAVTIKIMQIQANDNIQQVLKELIAAGIVTPPQCPAPAPPLSNADREILSRELGSKIQKPLSEIIIEERDR